LLEKKTEDKYNYILNIRCIAYTINLIATNLKKIDDIKGFVLVLDCEKITRFFNNSY